MLDNSNEKQVAKKQEAGLPSDALFEADARKGFENVDARSLRDLADQLRNSEPNTIVTLVSVTGDKIPLIVACSKNVEIDAREIMKHLVNQVGGSGGGRPDFAQGGADNSEDLEVALDSVADLVVSLSNQ